MRSRVGVKRAPIKPIELRPDALARFLTKFAKSEGDDGCWLWLETDKAMGYGQFCQGKKKYAAHRVAYTLFVGPIPDGMFIDHLCRVRKCVNPNHLEAVTNAENIARAPWTAIQLQTAKTHCPAGHEYDEKNTYRHKGERHCRACAREKAKRYRLRRAGKAA